MFDKFKIFDNHIMNDIDNYIQIIPKKFFLFIYKYKSTFNKIYNKYYNNQIS